MKLGVIMDPISGIKTGKDSTFAMLLAAQTRGWELYYMEQSDLFISESRAMANSHLISVQDNSDKWYQKHRSHTLSLVDLDVVLMRKDPPFDMEYVFTTYILELARQNGAFIVNDPTGLRDINEKMFINYFPQCTAPTLICRKRELIMEFIRQHNEIILKPLHGMGGASVFMIREGDLNTNVIIETMTAYERRFVMAQKFIPEIRDGDKRILLINGEPVKYALTRIPGVGEIRGNLAAGGTGKGVELTDRDRWICSQVGPELRDRGLLFVGLDVIGNYLTEINVTSPTCIRELDSIYHLDIAGQFIDILESLINNRKDH